MNSNVTFVIDSLVRLNNVSNVFFLNGPIPASFLFIFVFSTVTSKYNQCKILPMTGFEPRISGIGSDGSAH